MIPSVVVLALENYGAQAGAASALLGTLQLVTGAVIVGLVGAISDETPLPMVATIAVLRHGRVRDRTRDAAPIARRYRLRLSEGRRGGNRARIRSCASTST